MTFAEFHAAVGRIAGHRYHSSSTTLTTYTEGRHTMLEMGGYIDGMGWHYSDDPNRVLALLSGTAPTFTAEQLGELPAQPPAPTIDHPSEF